MPLYQYAPILTLVQNACVQLNLAKPTGVYDSQDEHAILMGSYANLIGPMLAEGYDWQQFNQTFSVLGDGVQTAFPLPADFGEFIDDTGWSLSNRRPVIIINEQQWASIEAWLSQSYFVNPACKIDNDNLNFITAPGLNEQITFTYTSSRYWAQDGANASVKIEALVKNSDIPLFDQLLFTIALRLKWQEIRGMPTQQAQSEFDTRLDQVLGRNQMAGALSLNGGTGFGFRYLDNWVNSPDTGFGN